MYKHIKCLEQQSHPGHHYEHTSATATTVRTGDCSIRGHRIVGANSKALMCFIGTEIALSHWTKDWKQFSATHCEDGQNPKAYHAQLHRKCLRTPIAKRTTQVHHQQPMLQCQEPKTRHKKTARAPHSNRARDKGQANDQCNRRTSKNKRHQRRHQHKQTATATTQEEQPN